MDLGFGELVLQGDQVNRTGVEILLQCFDFEAQMAALVGRVGASSQTLQLQVGAEVFHILKHPKSIGKFGILTLGANSLTRCHLDFYSILEMISFLTKIDYLETGFNRLDFWVDILTLRVRNFLF